MTFALIPLTLAEANEFVRRHHRHHGGVAGHKFSLGATCGDRIVGVAIIGRPVSRIRDDGLTLEVSRLCTDGERNACSYLLGAAACATFALGYKRIGTYIRKDESGITLKGAGWRMVGEVVARSWSCRSRPRVDKTDIIPRLLYEVCGSEGAARPSARDIERDFEAEGGEL